MEHVIRKPESASDEKLNHLLEFIVRNKQKLRKVQSEESDKNGALAADIVCFRGLLRLIMCSPYERRDAWIILATKYKGTIYLCALDTEKQVKERINMKDATKRIFSYGFKFEQFLLSGNCANLPSIIIKRLIGVFLLNVISISFLYIISDDPSKKPATNEPVNECDEFCCLFSATLNGQKILYGAEMDGIESEEPFDDINRVDLNQCKFIELKVTLRAQHAKQKENYFRFKQRNWWCQCFLVNIKKIIVGTRTNDGIVNELSTKDVRDIPKQCKVMICFQKKKCDNF